MKKTALPFVNPKAQPRTGEASNTPCTITFAHNEQERRVALSFSGPVTTLFFSPEDAEDVAAKLVEEARKARGVKH